MKQEKYPGSGQNPAYLLFWPVFGLRYLMIERFQPAGGYHAVSCSLDDKIPFLEGFVIPYFLWYFCIIGIHLWLYRRNDPVYGRYSTYLILTMSVSTVIFLAYPTCQNLRPSEFPRDNLLTDTVRILYRMDTSSNVCPSEHVIGSAGFFLGVAYSHDVTGKKRVAAGTAAFLTAISTVFLKQHSVVDLLAAIPVCLLGWYGAFLKQPACAGRVGNKKLLFWRFS